MSAKTEESTDTYNIDLATRQIEINEWSYNNKMETLFIFQIVFISLLLMSVLFYFKNIGVISGSFVWYVFILIVLIVGLIIINRAAYTNRLRDSRHWNRRRFADDNILPSPVKKTDEDYIAFMDAMKKVYPNKDCVCPGKSL